MPDTLIDQALRAAAFAVLVLDEDDRVVDLSLSAVQLFRFDPDELIGKPVSMVLALSPITSLSHDQAFSKPPSLIEEVLARDKDSREFPVTINAARWSDANGTSFTSVFIQDLAEVKEAGRLTQSQLVQSDNAIRGANIGVFEFNPIAQTVIVSDIWRQMLELGPDEQINVREEWQSRVHPDDLARALEPVRICSDDEAERASCEYRLHSRDRSRWLWMRTDVAVAKRDKSGKPVLLVGAQTDITARKETEEALRVSVAQFRSAFHNAPIGKSIVGLDGAMLIVNSALTTLLGYTESALLGTKFQALTHPDDLEADLRLLAQLVEGSIPSYTIEKRYFRANGTIMWGRLSVGMVRNAEGKPDHFVSQVVDITEQRRIDELRTEFVSVVSHELRTPLTSILGALTLIEDDDNATFPDEVQRLLYIAKINGERLHHLVNDILDFQKFSAKQMPVSLSLQPVASLVDETLLANLPSADKHRVRFSTNIVDRSIHALVDPKRFNQVMANLLSNAVKFADPDSTVTVSFEHMGSFIRLAVSNIGQGIPDAFRDRVFKPFSQAASLSDRKFGGTGLGLSITKQIVEQMGGEIGFESVPGQMTTFWFSVQAEAPSKGNANANRLSPTS